MATITEMFKLAVQHHQSGNLPDAEPLYRQVLQADPAHADAHHLLGVLSHQSGRHEAALAFIRRAIALKPGAPGYHYNLGNILKSLAQPAEALACYRQAVQLNPQFVEAYVQLADLLQEHGKLAEAAAYYRQALHLSPQNTNALNNLAAALLKEGHLGESAQYLRQALRIQPNYALAHINLGNVLKDLGQLDAAIQSYRQALHINPQLSETHYNLGNALVEKGHHAEAIACFRQALLINPSHADGHYNLGNALAYQGLLDEAIVCYRESIHLRPNYAEAHVNLGNALKDQALLDEALACYEVASSLESEKPAWQSNRLYSLLFHPDYDARALFEELCRWEREHAQSLTGPPIDLSQAEKGKNMARRLRIGYISPDFRDHVVGRNVLPLLRHHDHEQFEITLYANSAKADALTSQFRRHADHWRAIADWSDEKIAEQIRQDGIDILVDLTLHLAGNRLLVFARKPAPVQVTFAGYPGSTGLAAIDYRLTDPTLDPRGLFDKWYAEASYRLPHSFWCYDPPSEERGISSLPALTNGTVTFGCLNNFCKINDNVLKLWARVMRGSAGSRLLLLAKQGSHRQRTHAFLADHGIAPERIEFRSPLPQREYLALYHQIDMGLDTFPYNGHSTSLDSYWMGVPVITLVGDTVVGRGGLSQLTNLGLAEMAAKKPEEFVRLAVDLANDRPRLQALRSGLRERMRQSPLMDAKGFALAIETAYRDMWQSYAGSRSKVQT